MSKNEFKAIFKRRDSRLKFDVIVETINVDFKRLEEKGKLKAKNYFNYKQVSYLFDDKEITCYDSEMRPVLEYFVGIMTPIPVEKRLVPLVTSPEKVNGKSEYKIIDGALFNKTYDRAEMKSIIASSQQEKGKFDWVQFAIGVLTGVAIGIVAGLALYHYIVPTNTATTVTHSEIFRAIKGKLGI